jgi:23S rRNA pseudouridine1911/1915/1917 synthase
MQDQTPILENDPYILMASAPHNKNKNTEEQNTEEQNTEEQNTEEQSFFSIKEKEVGLRLDLFLTQHFHYSRVFVQKMIQEGFVSYFCTKKQEDMTKKIRNSHLLEFQDEIVLSESFFLWHQAHEHHTPYFLPINIVYEDDDLWVIDKAVGQLVHPGNGQPGTEAKPTLLNGLLYHIKNSVSHDAGNHLPHYISNKENHTMQQVFFVHRLDQNTSGLMVVAKNITAHNVLTKQLSQRQMKRYYKALIHGLPNPSFGTLEHMIMTDRACPVRKKIMPCKSQLQEKYDSQQAYHFHNAGFDSADHQSKIKLKKTLKAITHYRILKHDPHLNISLALLKLETGRTHQIRAQMHFVNHPIVGDGVYSNLISRHYAQKYHITTQCLHSTFLSFSHPVSGAELTFQSERLF